MKIISIIENISDNENLKCEHGLCLYIETVSHKILFDLGAGEKFIDNAKELNIDLSEVDTVIISHGHSDHGGGLKAFLDINQQAVIYLHEKAFGDYFGNKENGDKFYAGLDKEVLPNDQFVFIKDFFSIDDELSIFSNVKLNRPMAKSNDVLFEKVGDEYFKDNFEHEQNLIIKENNITLLIAGCAHKGIVNIIEHMSKICDCEINYVIGGFHLHNPTTKEFESSDYIKNVGKMLNKSDAKFYTCHCTGVEAFNILQEVMGDKIQYFSTGSILSL